jgi:hypothetical protein
MRKVILQQVVSLHGYVAGPNGDVNSFPHRRGDPRWGAEQSALVDTLDTLLTVTLDIG